MYSACAHVLFRMCARFIPHVRKLLYLPPIFGQAEIGRARKLANQSERWEKSKQILVQQHNSNRRLLNFFLNF